MHTAPRPHAPPAPRKAWLRVACTAAALLTPSWHATAQAPTAVRSATAASDSGAWRGLAQDWINQQLRQPTDTGAGDAPGPVTLRPEVQVGELDSRLRLAPCERVEPFLPPGTRLWGRARIGLRCAQGSTRWQVYLPVTVQAWGPAWVLRQPVAPGTALTPDDAEPAEVDWAASPTPVLARAQDWVGAQASRALMPGQTLRQGMVRPAQLFNAGTQVTVRVQGGGYALSARGEAVSHGLRGQTTRVRMPNGRIVSGTAVDEETVDIAP